MNEFGKQPDSGDVGKDIRQGYYEQNKALALSDEASIRFGAAIVDANPEAKFDRPGTNSMDLYAHFMPMLKEMVPNLIADPDLTDEDILKRIKSTQKYYYSTAGDDPNLRYDIPDDVLLEFIRAQRPPTA